MNGHRIALPRLLALFVLLAALPGVLQANNPDYTSTLPIVFTAPGVLIANDEDSLRAAIETANASGQLPRIEITADIPLTAPLPALDNPQAGTAFIAGNDHTLDGARIGTVLAIGPETAVFIERLTITNGSGSSGPDQECGGGIYSEGWLTLHQSRVENNWARRGGGICLYTAGPTTAVLTLEESTLAGNKAYIVGGGLYAGSANGKIEVHINDSLIQGNIAVNSGGGIFAYASEGTRLALNLEDSTLSANQAEYFSGGAITSSTYEGTIMTYINRCTIVANSAASGAGLVNEGSATAGGDAQVIINNSTFSANVSYGNGGAITNVDYDPTFPLGTRSGEQVTAAGAPQPPIGGAHLQLLYSTVTANRANRGSGIWNDGWLRAMASIIAGNEAGGRDCWQPISSWGYNLDGDGTCGLNEVTDLPKSQAGLLPLALVPPGNTGTHALGPDSQARDRIPVGEFGCEPPADTDQRGVLRPQPFGGLCDIGAFEDGTP